MNKTKLTILFILLLIPACSLDKKTSIWKEKVNVEEQKEVKIKKLFRPKKVLEKELNPTLIINLKDAIIKKEKDFNLDNNFGRINFEKYLNKTSNYKFSKISNFDKNEANILFYKNDLIFFENKGSLIRIDKNFKQVWKFNHYSKVEKKSEPFLLLSNNIDTLVIADNISKFYAVNINNGNLIWSRNNSSPFNSEIKIYKDNFYVVDFENILHCFSLKDGKEIWSFKTENVLIKSQKNLSIVIDNNIVFFNNSLGDITALKADDGKLIWQLPTQNDGIFAQSFSLKNSDLVLDDKKVYFSNNRNEFYSIDSETGSLNWQKNINSYVRPVIIDNIIITISTEGFLIIIDKLSGKIIRATDVFDVFKKKKRTEIYPIEFTVGLENIYLTTSNGRLLILNIKNGKTKKIIKIDNNKISRPFIKKNILYIVKDNSIIRFD